MFSVDEPLQITDLELGTYAIEEINVPEGYTFKMISNEEVTFTEDYLDFTIVVENSIDGEIILDEEVPLGEDELPRTGQRHPRDFFIIGLMITGLGVMSKRFFFKPLNQIR